MTLKAARINAGLTQKAAAKKLDITKGTLGSYEAGKSIPKMNMAKKIAKLYACSIDDIKWVD